MPPSERSLWRDEDSGEERDGLSEEHSSGETPVIASNTTMATKSWSPAKLSILVAVLCIIGKCTWWFSRSSDNDVVSLSSRSVLLIGVTGAGKSTIGNVLLGKDAVFEVGHTIESQTSKVSMAQSLLFGNRASRMSVSVIDSGGLGDTEGRDEDFLDDIASYLRNNGGVHGVVYVHNACEQRLSYQSRKTLRLALDTLTKDKSELRNRLGLVLTHCVDNPTRAKYQAALPNFLCTKFELCDVKLFWYDDYSAKTWIFRAVTLLTSPFLKTNSWREDFQAWTHTLPSKKMQVPTVSQREFLKNKSLEESKNDTSCFSANSIVIDRFTGPRMMKDLEIGSEVATADGWASVTTLLHWHPTREVQALKIVHESGSITLSPEHLVFVSTSEISKISAIPAMEVTVGSSWSRLRGNDGSFQSSKVLSVHKTTMAGYYAPLTFTGTIIVDDIVASCYTRLEEYQLTHETIHTLAAPLRFISSRSPAPGERHPVLRFALHWMDYFWF